MDAEERQAAESRIELVFELVEDGIALTRERLRRKHPNAAPADIERELEAWLRERPGAPIGDGDGRPIRLPRR